MKRKRLKSILACALVLCMVFGVQSVAFATGTDDTVVQQEVTGDTTDTTNVTNKTDDTEDTDTTGKNEVNTETAGETTEPNSGIAPASADDDIAPLSNDTMSGYCGAAGNETSVMWKLEQNNEDNDNPTYTLTISGTGAMKDYSGEERPAWYEKNRSKITKVLVNDGITSIGNATFSGCDNMVEVSLPEGLLSIGEYAFESTLKLEAINFPSTLTEIKSFAFLRSGLKDVTLPVGITTIANSVFKNCTNLQSITANNVTAIGTSSFENCSNLSNITFSEVTKLGNNSFRNCSSIISLPITYGIEEIPTGAFENCTALSSIIIPDSVKTIGNKAFNGCTQLTTVTLPGTVEKLGSNNNAAFSNPATFILTGTGSVASHSSTWASGIWTVNKSAIKRIIVVEGITEIDTNAFRGLTSMEYVQLPSSISSIGEYAFYGDTAIKTIDMHKIEKSINWGTNAVFQQEQNAFIVYISSSDLEDIADKCTTNTKSNMVLAVLNNGTFTDNTEFTADTLAIPTKAGYIFKGWYDNEQGAGNSVTTPETGKTYYAIWEEKTTTTISFSDSLNLNKTYDGNAVSISADDYTVTEGAGAVTFSYQTQDENGSWQDIASAPINAGTYRVKAAVSETDTHKSAEAWKEFTIGKADQSISYPDTSVSVHITDTVSNTLTQTTVDGTVSYTSDNHDVATVDENGVVTISGAGTATITATAKATANYNEASASYTLTVSGHDWEDTFTVDKAPTETTPGSKSIHCKICEAVKDVEMIPALGTAADKNPTNTDKKSTNANTSTSNSPRTGDAANTSLWITLVILSGGLLTVVTVMKKKRSLEK